MKKTAVLLVFVLLGCAPFSRGANETEMEPESPEMVTRLRFEAEEATLLDGILVLEDSTAGGGKFLRMADAGSVRFTVPVEQAGRYAVGFRFRTLGSGKAQRLLINDTLYAPEIGFPAGLTWSDMDAHVGLVAGVNTLELRKSWGQMDIDYITVSGPIFEPPKITPLTNTFYLDHTETDLFIQVETNQNEFLSLTRGQDPVAFETEEVGFLQDAFRVKIPRSWLSRLPVGTSELVFGFRDAEPLTFRLEIKDDAPKANLTVVSLDVRHGTSVLICLPTGKKLLVDTGTEHMCRQRVLPFLRRHAISLDTLWITHYHDDHSGGVELLTEAFDGLVKKDYRDFTTGQQFEMEGVKVEILNSYSDGVRENSRSLAFRMEYKGFVYIHDGDIYGHNQERILGRFTERGRQDALVAHLYHANHHFHGSVDVAYLRAVNPYLMLVSAEEHVYGRSAYTLEVRQSVVPYLKKNKRLIEDLLPFEVGHMVVRAADAESWNYETYKDLDAVVPWLGP